MPETKIKSNRKRTDNDELPTIKDFAKRTNLTVDEKESLEAFRSAMKALRKEKEKYGNRLEYDSRD